MFRVFGRIGLLSFGGPAAQIALMHKELVEDRNWLDEQTFLRALSLCMLLPGPEAMQLATYAGWRLRGTAGGLVAGGLFVLPGALVIAGLVGLYVGYGQLPLVQAAFLGIKATVVVIVLQALVKLSDKALIGPSAWVIAGSAFLAIFAFDLPFPLIVALAGLWGFASANSKAAPEAGHPFAPGAALRTSGIWLTLWLGPLIALSVTGPALLRDIGWLFAKLAVVTFGGAYAVLAYLTQTIVQDYRWIDTAQMIDALGLAETTPGPLILVTQFVAMLAGHQAGGWPLALAAGAVALWATFIPCFLWIFLAAPYLDHLSGRPRLSAALRAITAAVVGVILNLTIWFAMHVFFDKIVERTVGPMSFPQPDVLSLNLPALGLTGLAAVALMRLRLGMAATLALAALAGMLSHLV
ncbi:chromate efflux transporter [Sedimentitalea sp. JM2-8]|uniref:Chromate efflux transporter n=1 Tax=Sedimentitalea xiamensis TaxID=3050037 RepID=A0ABT7FHC6_9RHOB|nr:chromate efflux transporter [Sedimentitalea xiamensis]MDK3074189.1 chromate efflux transporter [Sedimentitalea xiamensis]